MDEGRVPELDPNFGYKYDVFAVCGDSVKSWTEEHLQGVIADTWGFKIYRNDFDCALGVPIAEQWCDAIEQSRKVILCLTEDFALDKWNEFIILKTMGNDPAFEKRKVLPIKLTPGSCLPRCLDGIMNYLDWPRLRRNKKDQKYFWQNIRRSLLEGRNTAPNGSPPPQPPDKEPLTEVKQWVSSDDDSTGPKLNLAQTIPRNNPVNQDQNETDRDLVYPTPSQTLEGVSYEFVNESKTVTQCDEDKSRTIAQHDEEIQYNQNVQINAIFFLGVILASLYNWLWSLAWVTSSDPG